MIGTVIFAVGVGLLSTGHPIGELLAAIGSFVVLFAILLFGWMVFRGERNGARMLSAAPAE
jgi:hypothetical protein